MKLYGINPDQDVKDFSLAHGPQKCLWCGSATLRGCKQYLVPVRIPPDVPLISDNWGIRPSKSFRPILQANNDITPGLILRLTAYSVPGKAFGRILVHKGILADDDDHLKLVAYGIAGLEDNTRWEEALIWVTAPTGFVLHLTNLESVWLTVSDEFKVTEGALDMNVKNNFSNWLPINHLDIPRWKSEEVVLDAAEQS